MGLSQTWPARAPGATADPLYSAWQAARRARAIEWASADPEAWRQGFGAECRIIQRALAEHIAGEMSGDVFDSHTAEHARLSLSARRMSQDAQACSAHDVAAVVELVERAALLEMNLAQHQNRLRQAGVSAPRSTSHVSATMLHPLSGPGRRRVG